MWKSKKIIYYGIGILGIIGVECYAIKLYQNYNLTQKIKIVDSTLKIESAIGKVLSTSTISWDEKRKIIDNYFEIIGTDPDSKLDSKVMEFVLKDWKQKYYIEERERLYAISYIKEGLKDKKIDQFNRAHQHFINANLSKEKQVPIKQLMNIGRKYINESITGQVKDDTVYDLVKWQQIVFKGR